MNPASPESSVESAGRGGKVRRVAGIVLSVGVLLGALAMGAHLLVRGERFPRTDDATVSARYTAIATEVAGRIVELAVSSGDRVEKGDLLLRVDPSGYRLAVEQAAAERAVLEATLRQVRRERRAAQAEVEVAEANVERALAARSLARKTVERLEPMKDRAFVTGETYDEALAALEEARADVTMARSQAEAARLGVPELEPVERELAVARLAERQAALELRRCEVRAPFDGRVVNLDFPEGRMALPGEPLFTLVDTSEWFVVARFREGDLGKIRTGDAATVRVLIAPGKRFPGTVESIGWGVQSDAEFTAGELPFVRSELDWVRLAQRFPVRIRVDDPTPATAFRIGASAVVTLETGDG